MTSDCSSDRNGRWRLRGSIPAGPPAGGVWGTNSSQISHVDIRWSVCLMGMLCLFCTVSAAVGVSGGRLWLCDGRPKGVLQTLFIMYNIWCSVLRWMCSIKCYVCLGWDASKSSVFLYSDSHAERYRSGASRDGSRGKIILWHRFFFCQYFLQNIYCG